VSAPTRWTTITVLARALCVIVGLICAITASRAQPVQPSPEAAAQLSRMQFLGLVETLIRDGRLDDARHLVMALPDDDKLALDKLFLRAKIAGAEGKPKEAELLYRAILRRDPDLHRVRLDLALSLFKRGNLDAADYHMRLVLAADIPDAVRENIRRLLGRIRKERWWQISLKFAIVPDSNINTGPNNKTVQIFDQTFRLSDEATETSGLGIETSADAEIRPRVGENLRWALGVSGYWIEYLEEDFDDRSAALRTGPVFIFPRGEVLVFGQIFKRWFSDAAYSQGRGATVHTSYDYSDRILLDSWASVFSFDNDVDEGLDGHAHTLGGAVTYTLSDRGFVRVFGGWTRDSRVRDADSSHIYRIGVGLSHELVWGLAGYVSPELRKRQFDGQSGLFGETRSDDLYRLEGRLIYGREILPDLTPFLSVAYEKNDSNIGFYSYKRIKGSVGFTKRF